MKRTIPRNVNAFGERFILAMIRRFPDENALISLSKLTGMCEPLCRKITTRPDPSMNQIRHLLAMCEIVSKSPSDFDRTIMKQIRTLKEYENAMIRLERKIERSGGDK